MELASLVKLSRTEAAEYLAKQAVTAREKRAGIGDTLKSWGNTALDFAKDPNNAPITAGLAGAGIGAGMGALGELGQPKERRRYGSSMLTGALAGGAIGAGGGLAYQNFGNIGKTTDPAKAKVLQEIKMPDGTVRKATMTVADGQKAQEMADADGKTGKIVKDTLGYVGTGAPAGVIADAVTTKAVSAHGGLSMNPKDLKLGIERALAADGSSPLADQYRRILAGSWDNDTIQHALARARATGNFDLPAINGPAPMFGAPTTLPGAAAVQMDRPQLERIFEHAGVGRPLTPGGVRSVFGGMFGGNPDSLAGTGYSELGPGGRLAPGLWQRLKSRYNGTSPLGAAQLDAAGAPMAQGDVVPTPGFRGAVNRKLEGMAPLGAGNRGRVASRLLLHTAAPLLKAYWGTQVQTPKDVNQFIDQHQQ